MDKKRLTWLVSGLALAILVIGALFLFSLDVLNNHNKAGPSDKWQQSPQWQPGENNGRLPMNMSEEERQQMMEARMQTAITACHDKAEGDACTMQGPGGDMTGTCKTGRDGSGLMCNMGMNMMRGSGGNDRSWER